jgi:hypothetical protein
MVEFGMVARRRQTMRPLPIAANRTTIGRRSAARSIVMVAALWLFMQAVIRIAGPAPPSRAANIDWWLAVSTLQLERGLSHVWTPYPPLFPSIHAAATKLVAGEDEPALRRWFFANDRSSWAAHERVLSALENLWISANALMIAAIAGIVFFVVRRTRSSRVAGIAGAAFVLSQIAPESLMRIGFGNDQFDYLPSLLFIGAISLAEKRRFMSAALAAMGILAKIFPFVALAVSCARARSWREAGRPMAFATSIIALGIAPFAISDFSTFVSTWRFSSERSGWESIWLYPEKRWPPEPRASAMPALFAQPFDSTATAQIILQDGRTLFGAVSKESADTITFRAGGHEQSFPRSSIAAVKERRMPSLRVRVLTMLALLLAAATPFAVRRSLDSPGGAASAALLSITVLLFFTPGFSSYFFLWLVPLLFMTLTPEVAMAVTTVLVIAAHLELQGWPSYPFYWWGIGARQLLLGALGLILFRRLRKGEHLGKHSEFKTRSQRIGIAPQSDRLPSFRRAVP